MSATEDDVNADIASINLASLDSIPNELFLMICNYIDADTLSRSLMFVNKQFYAIIDDAYMWKKRVIRKFKDYSVAFMRTNTYNENTYNWRQFAWRTELEYECWSRYDTSTMSTTLKGTNFAEVDAVIMTIDGNHCVTASRDRSICMWDTTDTVNNPVVHKTNSHVGWIWELQIFDDLSFLSCSWDSKIKLWGVEGFSQEAEPLQTFTADSAVLSITSKENFIAAGVYTRKILTYDPRRGGSSLFELIPCTRSIIELCSIQDYYLVSLSEDKTLAVWDLRTKTSIKSIDLAKHGSRLPLCATYYDNILFVSDSVDYVYWLDCSDGLFNIIEIVDFVKLGNDTTVRNKINCIKCTKYGSIITGGTEGSIYITTATNPPEVLAKIVGVGTEIAAIDYQNNTLAVGYVNSEVQIWKKK